MLLLLATFDAIRGERRLAAGLGVAAALAVAMALPWLIRNQVLFGSAIYPAFAPDMDWALFALNRTKFSLPALVFIVRLPAVVGPIPAAMALLGAMCVVLRRQWDLRVGLVAAAVVGMVMLAFVPMSAARHVGPFIPVMTLTSAWIVFESVAERGWVRHAVSAVLLITAIVVIRRMPAQRVADEVNQGLHWSLGEIAALVPKDATILSLWTYDTFYYSRRAATWPTPWGQRTHPIAMFDEPEPDRFLEELKGYGIDYLFVPTTIKSVPFNSANYPETFMECVVTLERRGRLELVWHSPKYALLRVGRAAS